MPEKETGLRRNLHIWVEGEIPLTKSAEPVSISFHRRTWREGPKQEQGFEEQPVGAGTQNLARQKKKKRGRR